MSTSSAKPTLEKTTADPDDDVDDLDDLLSEFDLGASSKSPPPAPPPSATGMTTTFDRPRNNTRVDAPPSSIPGSGSNLSPADEADDAALSSELLRKFARGMESLMRVIAGEVPAAEGNAGSNSTEDEQARTLKAFWQAMLVEDMDSGNIGEGGLAGLGEPFSKEGGGGFQDTIKQAVHKLKESESKFQSDSGANFFGLPVDQEFLDAAIKKFGDLGRGQGQENDTKKFEGLLEVIMGQLVSKEILYEPLKDLADGFPPYLEKPPAPISAEDRTRYESQLACVRKILAVFERAGYSDTNPEDNKQIMDLMNEMESYGTPPNEVMGSLPPELDGSGSIPGFDEENCTIA